VNDQSLRSQDSEKEKVQRLHYKTPPNIQGLFSDLQNLDYNIAITFGNGTTAPAMGIGTIHVDTFVESSKKIERIVLDDALYIPEAMVNLISVRQATADGASFEFTHDRATIFKDGKPRAEGKWEVNVYKIDCIQGNVFLAKTAETPELWHRRFGHLGYGNLSNLLRYDLVSGIHVRQADFDAANTDNCEPCNVGKQSRLPLYPSETKTTASLQLLCMDVCGPITPASRDDGFKYFATVLDDYTGYFILIPLAAKSDTTDAAIRTIKFLATQSRHNTWELTTLPPGAAEIPVMWVYTIKRDGAGNVERFKAPRTWYKRLDQELSKFGFTPSYADPSCYVRNDKSGATYLLIYVDDILVIAKTQGSDRHQDRAAQHL
jgi:hypothetical protein